MKDDLRIMINKWFFGALFIILYSLFLIPSAFAADLSVDCSGSGSCTKSGTDPLFSQANDGFWYPGRVLSKQIYLKNSSSSTRDTALEVSKTSSSGDLESMMSVILSKHAGPMIWSGPLKDFFGSTIDLGNLDAGASALYDLSATFDPLAGNEYQGKEAKFGLKLGFWTEESEESGGSVQGSSTGSGGGTGGPAPCTATKPGTPVNLFVAAGPNPDQATLSWTKISPYTSFLVAYSDNNLGPKWGNPNIGNVDTFTVSGLGSGTYYFWVRGQNNCMPGDFAGPVVLTIGTGGVVTEIAGFSENTLGVSTPSAEVAGQSGQLTGDVQGAAAVCTNCIWWQVLIIELAALLLLGNVFRKNRLLLLSFIPILAYLVFLLLNRNCKSDLIFCQLFWLLDTLTFALYLYLGRLTPLKKAV